MHMPSYNFRGTTKAVDHDRKFDFSTFLSKPIQGQPAPDMVNLIKSSDETYQPGIIRTLIAAGNGIFEMKRSYYGHSLRRVAGPDAGLGGMTPDLSNGLFITQNPFEKIPRLALEAVLVWYQEMAKLGLEAQVNFYYNNHGIETVKDPNGTPVPLADIPGVHFWSDKLFSFAPKQHNSPGLTSADDHFYTELNRIFGVYVETHSHNTMDAFASGTDIANSQGDGFQLVFGHVLTAPVIHSWVTMGGVIKEGLTPEELSFIIDDVSNLTPRGSSVRTTVAIEEEFPYGEYVPSGLTMETTRSEATTAGYSKYLFAQADLSAHTELVDQLVSSWRDQWIKPVHTSHSHPFASEVARRLNN